MNITTTRFMHMNSAYAYLAEELLNNGKIVNNTIELNNVSFGLYWPDQSITTVRGISYPYLFAEAIWYMTGREDVEFIGKFAKLWTRISDDGVTNNSAYGAIMFHRYGFDQVAKVIELLKKDPESRRAVINFNVPNEHVIETKDEVCTVMLQFMIRDDMLHCTAVMRSNDIWYGLPYDVAFFCSLQQYIANRVGVPVGYYTHFTSSLHVYENFVSELEKLPSCRETAVPGVYLDIEAIEEHKHEIADAIMASDSPREEVVRLFKKYKCVEGNVG